MKKILIALLVGAIVLSVCGCSKTKKDASDTSEASTTMERTVSFEDATSATDKSGKKSSGTDTTTTKKQDSKSDKKSESKSDKKSSQDSSKKQTTTEERVKPDNSKSKYETPIIPID